MSKEVYYRQCSMYKNTQTGRLMQTSWIPEEFAITGKVLKLRENGVWDNGWIVETAGVTRVAEVPDYHSGIKKHHQATGDSMPKKVKR